MTDPGPGPSGPGSPGPGRAAPAESHQNPLGPRPQGEPPAASASVAADSEGRTGGVEGAPGAVPFRLPEPPPFSIGVARPYDGLPKHP
jgi:hypothetical protein